MSIFKKKSAADGNWEERGVIGTRIEISDGTVTVLWRNVPVLVTKFKEEREGDATELVLNERGMRYPSDSRDYATVTKLYLEGETLHFVEYFPITGESRTALTRTDNSRYGNYDIVDDKIAPMLQGDWVADEYNELHVKGLRMSRDGETTEFHVLAPRGGSPAGEYRIVDVDPSKSGMMEYVNMRFAGGVIRAVIPVCDAPSIELTFIKRK